MEEYGSIFLYCSQCRLKAEKKHLFRELQMYYIHPTVRSYPFMTERYFTNRRLLTAIERELSFFGGNRNGTMMFGELWSSVYDPVNRKNWGLYVLAEPLYNKENQMERGSCVFSYVLCPEKYFSLLSRAEILSAIRHSNLIKEWGKVQIYIRQMPLAQGDVITTRIMNYLKKDAGMQVIYEKCPKNLMDYWLEQIWKGAKYGNRSISCFYCYQQIPFEHLMNNRGLLPQIILMPNAAFDKIAASGWHIRLSMRGYDDGRRAFVINIPQIMKKDGAKGILLADQRVQEITRELHREALTAIDSIQLPPNVLKEIMTKQQNYIRDRNVAKRAFLYRLQTNETIPLVKYPFSIGSRKQSNGYQIRNNLTVSGVHAYIKREKRKVWIIDNNSRNGTSVNGRILKPGIQEQLSAGSQICISDEVFIFYPERICDGKKGRGVRTKSWTE